MKSYRVTAVLLPVVLMMLASCDDDPSVPNDVTSPVRVTNLTVTLAGSDSLRLQWTAPGDDGGSGTAVSYQIRRSGSAISAANFGSATAVPNPPAPLAGGTTQQFTIPGIDTTLVTHFALRAFDEAGNVSQVSNDAVWTPLDAPIHLVKDIPPFKDNSMFEESGEWSNGAGAFLFAGQTQGLNTGGIGRNRRALLAFAISDSLPAGAVVDSVRLTVHVSKVPDNTARTVSLHRASADWGEGASDAGDPGGQGTQAETGDASWVYRFHNTASWTTAGGDFAAGASAQTTMGAINTFSTWSSGQMAADVQAWLNTPAGNFGWVVIGNESILQSAKRFDSREHPTLANRPRLRVFYSVVP